MLSVLFERLGTKKMNVSSDTLLERIGKVVGRNPPIDRDKKIMHHGYHFRTFGPRRRGANLYANRRGWSYRLCDHSHDFPPPSSNTPFWTITFTIHSYFLNK